MPSTKGINHLGLAVQDLGATTRFFVEVLGWKESGYDESYPRTAVSDGIVRLTLWQVDHVLGTTPFHRRKNVGLHHLALEGESEAKLDQIHQAVSRYTNACVEFAPEPVGSGPRKHMMCSEPGGIRLEFIWPGI